MKEPEAIVMVPVKVTFSPDRKVRGHTQPTIRELEEAVEEHINYHGYHPLDKTENSK